MPAKRILTVFAALSVMVASLGGCAFWPTQPGKFVTNDGSPIDDEVKYCTSKDGAKSCAETTRNAIVRSKTRAFHTQLASSYVLLGLGTATGAAIAFEGARGLVKWLALSAAAVLGLDSVVRPGTQRTIYSTAERRITCELAKYEALDALSGDDPQESPDQPGDPTDLVKSSEPGGPPTDPTESSDQPGGLTDLRRIRTTALQNSKALVGQGASLFERQADKGPATTDALADDRAALLNAAVADAVANEQNVAQLAEDIAGLVQGRHASLGLATLRIRSSVIDDIAANLPSGDDLLKAQDARVLAQMQRLGVGGASVKPDSKDTEKAKDTKSGSPRAELNDLIANYRAVLESPECSPSTS